MIPLAALERGERAIVSVLRRSYPDCSFVIRDGSVRPQDLNVAGKVTAGTPADGDAVEEPGENVTALGPIKPAPEFGEGAARGKPRKPPGEADG